MSRTSPPSFLSRQLDIARLKFAFIYLVISGSIIIVFTLAALSAQRYALNKVLDVLESRAQQNEKQVVARLLGKRLEEFDAAFKERLEILNIVLLCGAGVASYVLSGYSLRSIRENVEKQEEFAADASHELRTPLTTISMEIVALQKTHKRLPEDVSTTLTSVQQEVQRMQQIVSGLLTLVRDDQAQEKISHADFNQVAAESVRQMTPLAAEKKITLKFMAAARPQPIKLSAEKCRQLCLIMIDNAIKYTPAGEVCLVVSYDKRQCLCTITDNGVGIPAADLPHIFDRFYRVQHHAAVTKGAGLGLTIAKKLVDEAKGTITVHSQLGEGTTFVLKFPRV